MKLMINKKQKQITNKILNFSNGKSLNAYSAIQKIIIPITIITSSFIVRLLFANNRNFVKLIKASLWAQNGSIFIHQANAYGIKFLWIPSLDYSVGYLQLYPRVITLLIVSLSNLNFMPYLFFLGWSLAVVIMSFVIINRLIHYNISPILGAIIVGLINLQPNYGLGFFNIVNTQWMIGIALTVYLLLDKNLKVNYIGFLFLIIASLTGPFSLILSPILITKIFIKRDFIKNISIYIIVFLSAFIQGWFIIKSGKISTPMIGPTDPHMLDWFKSFIIFLAFGAKDKIVIFLSIIFWITYFYLLLKSIRSKKLEAIKNSVDSLILVFTAIVFYTAALIVARSHPLGISPLSAASKYYALPYGIIFIAIIIIATSNLTIKSLVLITKALICILSLG